MKCSLIYLIRYFLNMNGDGIRSDMIKVTDSGFRKWNGTAMSMQLQKEKEKERKKKIRSTVASCERVILRGCYGCVLMLV